MTAKLYAYTSDNPNTTTYSREANQIIYPMLALRDTLEEAGVDKDTSVNFSLYV